MAAQPPFFLAAGGPLHRLHQRRAQPAPDAFGAQEHAAADAERPLGGLVAEELELAELGEHHGGAVEEELREELEEGGWGGRVPAEVGLYCGCGGVGDDGDEEAGADALEGGEAAEEGDGGGLVEGVEDGEDGTEPVGMAK